MLHGQLEGNVQLFSSWNEKASKRIEEIAELYDRYVSLLAFFCHWILKSTPGSALVIISERLN